MSKKLRVFVLALSLLALIPSIGVIQKAEAAAQVTPTSVYDDFDEILLKPDEDAYWWIINWYGEDTVPVERIEGYYGVGTSVLPEEENGVTYADLKLTPEVNEGYYANAEIAELRSGYTPGEPGQWKPSFRHPVIMEARVKWDGDFNQDGSGDAIGTSGIWLWDSPPDFENQTFNTFKAMGFSWNNDNSTIAKGLSATVMRQSLPVGIRKPLFDVDMDDWVDLKMRWETDLIGTQTVHFWVNGCYIGFEWLQIPIFEPLSLEIWHDNQTYSLLGGSTYETPVEDQSFLIDYINIYKN